MFDIIKKSVAIILSIIDDYVDEDRPWNPAWINGVWDPDLADKMNRLAQGQLFRAMQEVGLPLHGWDQFECFISEMENGSFIIQSWRKAQEAFPCDTGDKDGDSEVELPEELVIGKVFNVAMRCPCATMNALTKG